MKRSNYFIFFVSLFLILENMTQCSTSSVSSQLSTNPVPTPKFFHHEDGQLDETVAWIELSICIKQLETQEKEFLLNSTFQTCLKQEHLRTQKRLSAIENNPSVKPADRRLQREMCVNAALKKTDTYKKLLSTFFTQALLPNETISTESLDLIDIHNGQAVLARITKKEPVSLMRVSTVNPVATQHTPMVKTEPGFFSRFLDLFTFDIVDVKTINF